VATATRKQRSPKLDGIQPVGSSGKINIILYSFPGAGKTTFIGTGPPETLIIRPPTDHLDSIRGFKGEEVVVRNWDKMYEVLDYLRGPAGLDYKWVWLDSISLFQDTGLDDIWATVIAEKPHRKQYGLDKGEYGRNMFRLAQWIRDMVGAEKFNLGITAHPAELMSGEVLDDDDERLIMMPYIQGKNMSTKICGYMNIVGYLQLKRNKAGKLIRVLDMNATERHYGKDQYNCTPNGRMIAPTIPKLVRAIEGA